MEKLKDFLYIIFEGSELFFILIFGFAIIFGLSYLLYLPLEYFFFN